MRFDFDINIRHFVISAVVAAALLVLIFFPSLRPVSFFNHIISIVTEEFDSLHITQTGNRFMSGESREPLAPAADEKQTPQYARTNYEMMSPEDAFLAPPQPDLRETAAALYDQFRKCPALKPALFSNLAELLSKEIAQAPLANNDRDAIAHILRESAPLLRKTRDAARKGRFDLDDFAQRCREDAGNTEPSSSSSGEKKERTPGPVKKLAGLLTLDAEENLRSGQTAAGFEIVLDVAKILLPTAALRLEDQHEATEAFHDILRAGLQAAQSTKDTATLDSVLFQLNELARNYNLRQRQVPEPISRDLLSRLRALPLTRQEADSLERYTPDYLFDFYVNMRRKYTPAEGGAAQENLPADLTALREKVIRVMEARKTAENQKTDPPLSELTVLEKRNLAELDLLRLGIAEKLYQNTVESPEIPASKDHLSPRFIPYSPSDPFTGKEYQLRQIASPTSATRNNCFLRRYSTGPGHTDNGGKISYDPTNGTFSSGNIFFP